MAKEQGQQDETVWLVLGFAWRLGYSIAIPLVVLLVAGRWLDKKFDSSPLMLIIGLVISFVITNILMLYEAFRLIKQTAEVQAAPEKKSTPATSPNVTPAVHPEQPTLPNDQAKPGLF